ncbi:MAG: ribosome silencing factor [Solirubrobacterales bacterium]
MSSEELARRVAVIADAKKAEEIVVLDMRGLVGYTDFLVICTARNERQAKAVYDEVYLQLKREDLLPDHVEGERQPSWVLIDYLDCVLHVFVPEARDYYRLETLWGEAPRLELDPGGAAPRAASGAG